MHCEHRVCAEGVDARVIAADPHSQTDSGIVWFPTARHTYLDDQTSEAIHRHYHEVVLSREFIESHSVALSEAENRLDAMQCTTNRMGDRLPNHFHGLRTC